MPALLNGLRLDGCLASPDVLSRRREVADHILARGADHLLTLEANQGKAHDGIRAWLAAHALDRGAGPHPCHDAFDDTHGRLVRRRAFACPDAGGFATLLRADSSGPASRKRKTGAWDDAYTARLLRG